MLSRNHIVLPYVVFVVVLTLLCVAAGWTVKL